jgi:hypothetical protein
MENLPLDRFINGISLGQMGRMIFWAGGLEDLGSEGFWRCWDFLDGGFLLIIVHIK